MQGGAFDRKDWDDNGWFEVSDNPLSKVGVYQYSEASINRGGDRNKLVGVFRPAEELGSQECIDSFRLMPWTDDHPSELLGPKEKGLVPADEKGVRGVIGEQVYFKGDTLYGNIKVFSEDLARKIASGKRELSCGYHCQFVPEEGVYNGEPYQYVQRVIRGNHVASVRSGRMGSDVRVMDATERYFTFSLDMSEQFRPATPALENDVPIEEIIRDVRRDFATKERLARSLSSLPGVSFALDSGDVETAKEFAVRMLKNLGLSPAVDPITALNMFIHGRRNGAGMDSASRGGASAENSFMDRYLDR